jgi:hypothetical protein
VKPDFFEFIREEPDNRQKHMEARFSGLMLLHMLTAESGTRLTTFT